jgi:DNA-binding NtrC family response regulator
MSAPMKVLVVDDSDDSRNALSEALEADGHAISVAPNASVALRLAQVDPPDLILLDIVLPDLDGIQVCRRLKADEVTREIPVIFITARDEVGSMEAGFEAGGVDYITKPFHIREVSVRVQTHLRLHRLRCELEKSNRALAESNTRLEREITERRAAEAALHAADEKLTWMSQAEAERWGIPSFVGESQTFRRILGDIRRLHQFETTNVLITGESGTGKELVARAIHFGSPNSAGPFVPVNCSAIPSELAESLLFGHIRGSFTGAHHDRKGYFELANAGTLFLDEVGDMPLPLQAKLLRAVESGEIVPLGETAGRRV